VYVPDKQKEHALLTGFKKVRKSKGIGKDDLEKFSYSTCMVQDPS
jgi:hypothetical protein